MCTPMKSYLLEFQDPTPSSKKVVTCEINGWMETHLKQKGAIKAVQQKNRNIRMFSSPLKERTNLNQLK
jgi:hypothetical protein